MRIKDLSKTKRRYCTILADPPWHYDENKRHSGKSPRNQADDYYETAAIEDIRKIPVERIAMKDAHMYLWVTNAFIHEGWHLMKKWGFRQVTMITWVKPHWGSGWHFRGQTEHMLFGVHGSLPISPSKRSGTMFFARRGKHSAKPRQSYELIERVSPEPRIELFARRPRQGWDSWGREAKGMSKGFGRDIEKYL